MNRSPRAADPEPSDWTKLRGAWQLDKTPMSIYCCASALGGLLPLENALSSAPSTSLPRFAHQLHYIARKNFVIGYNWTSLDCSGPRESTSLDVYQKPKLGPQS
jgi:hypothetical protein